MKKIFPDYYLGLDIGTNSVGWAVTDSEYNVLKFNGKAMWGIRLFDEANTAAERRTYRSARRRLERKKQRIDLLQELLAEEIFKVDPSFYIRLENSKYHMEDKQEEARVPYTLFNDVDYTDIDYHKEFPTIYHLRYALMKGEKHYDIRLYYLAIHNILKHRGHFLFDGEDMSAMKFEDLFDDLQKYIEEEYDKSLNVDGNSYEKIKDILKNRSLGRKGKKDELSKIIDIKGDKQKEAVVEAISGSKVQLVKLFADETLSDVEQKDFSFGDGIDEDKQAALTNELGDRIDFVNKLQAIYSWSVLENILNGKSSISEAQIALFDKHMSDLKLLKKMVKKYIPEKYRIIFDKTDEEANYPTYTGHSGLDSKGNRLVLSKKKCTQEAFCEYIKKAFKDVKNDSDKELNQMLLDVQNLHFMPKQITKDNSVIPRQLHQGDLRAILENLKRDYPELAKDMGDGLSACEKVISIFKFRVPYYVGPLNDAHKDKGGNCWIVKKEPGRIYPWNFSEKVDEEASAEKFIARMTNKCTYLVGEDVLPKNSILYSKYMVLNELNNLKVNGEKISVELKQKIYEKVFVEKENFTGKVTLKKLSHWLVTQGDIGKEDVLTGVDGEFKASMKSYRDLRAIFKDNTNVSLMDYEDIIKDLTVFGDSKSLLKNRFLNRYAGKISEPEIKQLLSLKYADWGTLSRKLFEGIEAVNPETGELISVIRAMWETNNNFMELMSNKYDYMKKIVEVNREKNSFRTDITYDLVKESYVSPAVKRGVWQTLLIVKEIKKIIGKDPERLFVEVTRNEEKEKKRTTSRKEALLALYKSCKGEEYSELANQIKNRPEADFKQRRLYLYYTQMGKCMYTGESISLDELNNSNIYDLDHIYPQSKTKDDSIINNLVLVKKNVNGKKSDEYPLSSDIRNKMEPTWRMLKEKGFISEEKYNRLVCREELTDEQLSGFVARQLVETNQTTKAVAEILNEVLPETRIVYSRANAVSDFRHENYDYDGFVKVREINDYHHAKDAYLNIVVGNVYYTKFTENPANFFKENKKKDKDHKEKYSLNHMFDFDVERKGVVAWKRGKDGTYATVRKYMAKNNILFTRYATEKGGGLFDQQILKKNNGQIPIKSGNVEMSIEKYGGYNKPSINFFMLVESEDKKGKKKRTIEGVPMGIDSTDEEKLLISFYSNNPDAKNARILIPEIRINSLLKLNGYPMMISGKSNNRIAMKNGVQLLISHNSFLTVKRIIKSYTEYTESKDESVFNRLGVDRDKNVEVYDELTQKHSTGIYKKRAASQAETLNKGRDKFVDLSIIEQCKQIIEILHLFECSFVSADLKMIGGSGQAGVFMVGKEISKNDSAYMICQSVTGLFENKIDLLKI